VHMTYELPPGYNPETPSPYQAPPEGAAMAMPQIGRSAVRAQIEQGGDHVEPASDSGAVESSAPAVGEGGDDVPPVEPPPTAEGAGDADDEYKAQRRAYFASQLETVGPTVELLTGATVVEPTPEEQQQAANTLHEAAQQAFREHADTVDEVVSFDVDTQKEVGGQRVDLRYTVGHAQADVTIGSDGTTSVKVTDTYLRTLPEEDAGPVQPHEILGLLPPANMVSYRNTGERVVRHNFDGEEPTLISEAEAELVATLVERAKPPIYSFDEVADMTPMEDSGVVGDTFDIDFLNPQNTEDAEYIAELMQNNETFVRAIQDYAEQAGKSLGGDLTHEEMRRSLDGTITIRAYKDAELAGPELTITERRPATENERYLAYLRDSDIDPSAPLQFKRRLSVFTLGGGHVPTEEPILYAYATLTESYIDPATVWKDPTYDNAKIINDVRFLPTKEDLRVLRRYLLQRDG
jgi:hypothetical protein